MAPTQQHSSESSSSVNNSNTASSLNMATSSKVQSNTKSTSSSCISNSSSHSSMSVRSNNNINASGENMLSKMDCQRDTEDSFLPITCRGLFYDDSFFEESRSHFEKAVKEVLDQWGGQRSDQLDDFKSYRKLRENNLQENNQVVSVSQDKTTHKVVLDVRDFTTGDIKVKMIDENELVVEGSVEKQESNSVSKKSFRRSFTFPGLIKSGAVSSCISADGVLSITVPKNNQNKESLKLINNDSRSTQKSLKSVNINSTHKELSHDANKDTLNFESSLKDIESDFLLPVTKKGLFFHDSFFESARQDFEKSVQEVLDKWGERDSMKDNMTSYRSLREQNLKEENQAISVTEEDDHHKVVLDVKDFMNGDIKVKMVDENELKIEGSAEQQKEGASSNKSFSRSFTFPDLIKSETVTSAMSADGILTVMVPKNNQNNKLEKNNSSNYNQSIKQKESTLLKSQITSERNSSNTKATKELESNNVLKNSPLESLLPISQKGLFFHDDFFTSARQEFENAVQEVLSKWGERTSLTDDMSSYRSLRDRNLRDENQAVSTSEDHLCHKVVIDVRDFMHNDLKVKVVDENELVVEGNVEKKNGESISKKSFYRSFIFPGLVKSDAVSSAMSSDGVLTITVPKNEQKEKSSKTLHSVANENINRTTASKKVSSFESTQKQSLHSMQEGTAKNSKFQKNKQEKLSSDTDLKQIEREYLLPISQRGHFFQDDFFANARQDFENAVKNVLNQWEESTLRTDDLKSYRTLREKDLRDENQAISMTEDHHTHKVVIDVGDFLGGDIQVKALDPNELLVEGRLEKEEGGKSSTKSFSRRFQLPGVVEVDAITSALSKDGVLIITAPKDSKKSKEMSPSEMSVHNHNSNKHISSSSHQEHSQQTKETSGSTTSTLSHSSTSQHFNSTRF